MRGLSEILSVLVKDAYNVSALHYDRSMACQWHKELADGNICQIFSARGGDSQIIWLWLLYYRHDLWRSDVSACTAMKVWHQADCGESSQQAGMATLAWLLTNLLNASRTNDTAWHRPIVGRLQPSVKLSQSLCQGNVSWPCACCNQLACPLRVYLLLLQPSQAFQWLRVISLWFAESFSESLWESFSPWPSN